MRAAIYVRILLGTLCLLALATYAGAEGAWVLWAYDERANKWDIRGSYERRPDCENAQANALQDWRRLGGKTNGETAVYRSGAMIVTYQCLPDTVDPRGPKGK